MTLADRSRPSHRTRLASSSIPAGSPAGSRTRTPRRIAVGGFETSPPAASAQPITLDAIPWNVFAREQAFPTPAAPSVSSRPARSPETAAPSRPSEPSRPWEPSRPSVASGASARFWLDWFPMIFLGVLSLASGILSIVFAIAR